jgi:VacB/RNase II family 3'-5' exoribonuclease
MNSFSEKARITLERIARFVMMEKGFLPDFSSDILHELDKIVKPETRAKFPIRDLRDLPWSSIDNDDSLDLDQLTVAETLPDNCVKILVAVADVELLVKRYSAIDGHAQKNTTSIYTAGKVFPMLPERLSTDLTSLNYHQERFAVIIEIIIDPAGDVLRSNIYHGLVRNQAKLAYNSIGSWLEGKAPMPSAVAAVSGLAENLRIQDRAAQILKSKRHERGALELHIIESRPIFTGDEILDMQIVEKNRAKEIIEDFMIVANDITADFLKKAGIPSLRRVVRVPKRWEKIVEVAAQHDFRLPGNPDQRALARFLTEQNKADPLHFPDLSLTVVKLLGPGEYIVESPRAKNIGHFGLAVENYTHSTAPNRRFPDLITQRILKAVLNEATLPYSEAELTSLANHCTEKEDDAKKVARLVAKSAAVILLTSRIGDQFEAICTGAAEKGTWVRIFHPPIEGRLIRGYQGVDVGDRLRVRLIYTDMEKGYIDFERVH